MVSHISLLHPPHHMPLLFADELPAVLPKTIPAYTFDNNEWVVYRSGLEQQSDVQSVSSLHLVTWNVDAKDRTPKPRIQKIIDHLSDVVFRSRSFTRTSDEAERAVPPCCVLFQEVSTEAFSCILCSNWIRNNFRIIPGSTEVWDNTFGLIILFSKNLTVSQAFIMSLPSSTQKRQALFVDVHLSFHTGTSDDLGCASSDRKNSNINTEPHTLRIANTHLESGYSHTDLGVRQKQLRYIASMLNVDNLSAYLCCGSMCSVLDEDSQIPANIGFSDSYSGPKFSSFTWGMRLHHLHRGFRAKRLDKILYHTNKDLFVECPDRVGFFLPISDTYASDHCGLVTRIGIKIQAKTSKQGRKKTRRPKEES